MSPVSLLYRLVLKNIVLVESCDLSLEAGFTAVTGETGAGKTALIGALHLCLGERADPDLIRKGCDKGYVELSFSLGSLPLLKKRLEELSLEPEEDLIIRRELSSEGKNRAFINCKAVPLSLLQEIGAHLIDLIGQHSHQTLRSSDTQRDLLDLFGSLHDEVQLFRDSYRAEQACQLKVEELQAQCLTKDKQEDLWRFQLEEIEMAQLKEGEEASLFSQYETLSHSQEIIDKLTTLSHGLSEGPSALIFQLNTLLKVSASLSSYDPQLQEVDALLHEALIPLKEAQRTVEHHPLREAPNPQLFMHLEERLSLLAKLKRKYGASVQDILGIKAQLEERLLHLSTLEEDLTHAQEELLQLQQCTHLQAKRLTERRTQSAALLQQRLTALLQELNMPGATVEIHVVPHTRSSSGEDLVQFWLQANTGERPSLVKEHASGGEVSRLLFALKITLAEKNNTPLLIFDEIDANVGGKTATLIGKKLKELGQYKQIVCITHFPQVASQADHHLRVHKLASSGRTLSQITPLTAQETQQELIRMGGG